MSSFFKCFAKDNDDVAETWSRSNPGFFLHHFISSGIADASLIVDDIVYKVIVNGPDVTAFFEVQPRVGCPIVPSLRNRPGRYLHPTGDALLFRNTISY